MPPQHLVHGRGYLVPQPLVNTARMGLVVPMLSVLALRQADADERGTISADLQISDSIFAALSLAIGGAVLGWLVAGGVTSYAVGFAVASSLPLVGLVVAHRAKPPGGAVQLGSRDNAHVSRSEPDAPASSRDIERRFECGQADRVPTEPAPADVRHVWVRGPNDLTGGWPSRQDGPRWRWDRVSGAGAVGGRSEEGAGREGPQYGPPAADHVALVCPGEDPTVPDLFAKSEVSVHGRPPAWLLVGYSVGHKGQTTGEA